MYNLSSDMWIVMYVWNWHGIEPTVAHSIFHVLFIPFSKITSSDFLWSLDCLLSSSGIRTSDKELSIFSSVAFTMYRTMLKRLSVSFGMSWYVCHIHSIMWSSLKWTSGRSYYFWIFFITLISYILHLLNCRSTSI